MLDPEEAEAEQEEEEDLGPRAGKEKKNYHIEANRISGLFPDHCPVLKTPPAIAVGVYIAKGDKLAMYQQDELLQLLKEGFQIDVSSHIRGIPHAKTYLFNLFKSEVEEFAKRMYQVNQQNLKKLAQENKKITEENKKRAQKGELLLATKEPASHWICYRPPTVYGEHLPKHGAFPIRKVIKGGLAAVFGLGGVLAALKLLSPD